jgi:hypothetical protein
MGLRSSPGRRRTYRRHRTAAGLRRVGARPPAVRPRRSRPVQRLAPVKQRPAGRSPAAAREADVAVVAVTAGGGRAASGDLGGNSTSSTSPHLPLIGNSTSSASPHLPLRRTPPLGSLCDKNLADQKRAAATTMARPPPRGRGHTRVSRGPPQRRARPRLVRIYTAKGLERKGPGSGRVLRPDPSREPTQKRTIPGPARLVRVASGRKRRRSDSARSRRFAGRAQRRPACVCAHGAVSPWEAEARARQRLAANVEVIGSNGVMNALRKLSQSNRSPCI